MNKLMIKKEYLKPINYIMITILLVSSLFLDNIILGDYDSKNYSLNIVGIFRTLIYLLLLFLFSLIKKEVGSERVFKIIILLAVCSVGSMLNTIYFKIMTEDEYFFYTLLIKAFYIIIQFTKGRNLTLKAKYIFIFLLLLIFNVGTFCYQEAMLDEANTFKSLGIPLLYYGLCYIIFCLINYLMRKGMSKNFILYNSIFPLFLIMIGLSFKMLGMDNQEKAYEVIKGYDFLLILVYIIFILCRGNNETGNK